MPIDQQTGQWVDSRWEPTIPFQLDRLPEMRVRARVDALDAFACGVNVALLQAGMMSIQKLGELSDMPADKATAEANTQEFAETQDKAGQTADDLEKLAYLMIVYPEIVEEKDQEVDEHHMWVGRLTFQDRIALFGLLSPKEVVAQATQFPDGGPAGEGAGVEPAQPVPTLRRQAKRSA